MCSSSTTIGGSGVEIGKNCYENLWSSAHVFHIATKQIISHRGLDENGCEMYNNEKCLCKACKTTVLHCSICKFVTFFSSSSSWLHKLPNAVRTAPKPPPLSANRSRLPCHDFDSQALKRQELQPLTLTSPGTSELIEISVVAL